MSQRPSKDFDSEQLNKCTLCDFRSHTKSFFERHLMKQHGIKLKNIETYAKNEGYPKKNGFQRCCPNCNKLCNSGTYYRAHIAKCSAGELYACPKCKKAFEKLARLHNHSRICGSEKNVLCQLCPYKSLEGDRMQRHYIDKHNLICKLVEEPDFDQVLNGTPYILERAVELETLPTIQAVTASGVDNTHIRLGATSVSKKRLFNCNRCKKEFTKERFLNRHKKIGCE